MLILFNFYCIFISVRSTKFFFQENNFELKRLSAIVLMIPPPVNTRVLQVGCPMISCASNMNLLAFYCPGASIKYDNRGRLKPGYVPYWDLPYPKSSFRGKPSVFSPDRRRMSRRSSSRELFRDGGRMSSPGYERDRYAPMDSRPPPSGGWSPRERKSVGYYGGPVDRAMPYEVHYRRPELDSRPLASSSRYPTDYDDRGRYESRSGRRPSPYPIRPRSRSPLPRGII